MDTEFLGARLWRAVDPARTTAREYSLLTTVDFFGRLVVEQRLGRIDRALGNCTLPKATWQVASFI